MKFIKKCPLFLLILSTGLLFTIIAISGKRNVYASQDYEPLKAPVLSVMFSAINDGIYPWQVLDGGSVLVSEPVFQDAASISEPEEEMPVTEAGEEQGADAGEEQDSGAGGEQDLDAGAGSGLDGEGSPSDPDGGEEAGTASEGDVSGNDVVSEETDQTAEKEDLVSQCMVQIGETVKGLTPNVSGPLNADGRLAPLRESTYDEYINHISADIYGNAGVLHAAEYDFQQVDESYFDDALFIGDSRTVGLRDYTDLAEHADFYCETSLTIYKVLEENFKGLGTIQDALAAKDYGKIYIMVGINELGRGTTEDYMGKYTEVVDTLHAWEPDAKIIIQGVMRVSKEKSSSDAIFNNSNINARNNAVATLADNDQIFYIDVNEVVCDEEGNLREDYTFDQIHLLGVYNDVWKQFLLSHGVYAALKLARTEI